MIHVRIIAGFSGLAMIFLVAAARVDAGDFDPVPLLPGMHRFDVTQAPFHATPDDDSDDTQAIQAALDAAAEYSLQVGVTRQQIVYLPQGTYLVSDTLRFPKNRTSGRTRSKVECDQWLWGDGVGKTIIRLRAAADSGEVLGTAEQPKPVVQTAEYRLDNRAGGNVNFQLWVTDLSIVVPADQPHAVGLSYGSANMGAVRRVEITAEGDGGHTGLALVQFNNGPGFVEHVRITGFDTGIEINDNWGESFTFRDITVVDQNPGGVGISITDKLIAMEQVVIRQDQPDATPIRLFDDETSNTYCGGAPHLTLLGARIECSASDGSAVPAIEIAKGHVYLRHVTTDGYGDGILRDHGRTRVFAGGSIPGEFVSVHGQAIGERPNVAVTVGDAPARSLNLPIESAPELPPECWIAARSGAIAVVSADDLLGGNLEVKTPWVFVDPKGAEDHTRLLQAALDSGARYVAFRNTSQFVVSGTLVVNGPDSPRNVEVVYGLMTDIKVDEALSARKPPYEQTNDRLLFRLETGRHDVLYIQGLHLIGWAGGASDFQLFQNNAGNTVAFENFRAKIGPRHYRNGGASLRQRVFLENVEWAYNGAFPQPCSIFSGQTVWARNFNAEMNITPEPVMLRMPSGDRKAFSRLSTEPKITNDGSRLWSFGQKMGEYNGVFVETRGGGKTELLSVFLNEALDAEQFPPTPEAVCLVIKGDDSACSMVGQERPRGRGQVPHANTFARIETSAGEQIIKGTDLPTYLTYEGMDPFHDPDPRRYFKEDTFRVVGLFRCGK